MKNDVEDLGVVLDHDDRGSVVGAPGPLGVDKTVERIAGCAEQQRGVGVKEDVIGRDQHDVWSTIVNHELAVEDGGYGERRLRRTWLGLRCSGTQRRCAALVDSDMRG